ncbi:hypothetical protein [Phaeospirillum tilakii]|uniref:BON domain-containing protein n=1 Tax=Phaeospirillum tilakii TaxID=741673 RepID=A0ABW5CD94_9PROT
MVLAAPLAACSAPVTLVADPLIGAGLALDRDALQDEAATLTGRLNAALAADPALARVAVIAALDRRVPGGDRVCYLVAAGSLPDDGQVERLRARLRDTAGTDCRSVINLSQVEWPGSPRARGPAGTDR